MRFDRLLVNNSESSSLNGLDFVVLGLRCQIPIEHGIEFRLNGHPLEWHPIARPDLPKSVSWFSVYLDLAFLPLVEENELVMQRSGVRVADAVLTIDSGHITRLSTVRGEIARKRDRVASMTQDGTVRDGKIHAIDTSRHDPALRQKSDKVSAHPYAHKFKDLRRELPPGAMILDVGAGFRYRHDPDIVTLEIFDYPSTDVIAFGDSMPFRSETFDIVYTNAVLEHVDNPFAVASEIERVLKPGGKLYSAIPFLQVEHGYPFHYFNATRMGHRRLFEDGFDIHEVSVGGAGHPWHIIMRSLGLLRSGLPKTVRGDFEKLTIGEILNGTYKGWVDSRFGPCSDEIMWRLAGSTVLLAQKKGRES